MTYIVRQRSTGMGDIDFAEVAATANPAAAIQTIIDNGKAIASAVPSESAPASDNINVSAAGNTSISTADFQPGTCKPMNVIALNYVKNLQSQLNRVASVKGFAKTGVDGQVGPMTLGLLKRVQAAFPSVMGDASSCLFISGDADVIGDQVKDVADSLKAPAQVEAAPSKIATIMTKSGLAVLPPGAPKPSAAGIFAGVTPGQAVVLTGIAGGIWYFMHKKKGGGKKGPK